MNLQSTLYDNFTIVYRLLCICQIQNIITSVFDRDLTAKSVPMSDPNVGVLITNSNVKHQLTGSEYPERRAACLDSARVMEVDSLRDVNLETLQAEME